VARHPPGPAVGARLKGCPRISRQGMDLVSLFAAVVFAASWFFLARTDPSESLVRLFFGALMAFAAGAGILGFAMRLFKV